MPIPHSTRREGLPADRRRAHARRTSPRSRASSCTSRSGASTPTAGAGNPDRLVLDLDPGPASGSPNAPRWRDGPATSSHGMGLEPLPVTSGSKGIHLYAALPGTQTSEQLTAVARELARAIEADHPDLVVSADGEGRSRPGGCSSTGARTTARRPRSRRTRCAAARDPTVAAPRTWEELDDPDLAHLLFDEVLERAETIGDPLEPLGFHAGGRGAPDGPLARLHRQAHRGTDARAGAVERARRDRRRGRAPAVRHPGAPRHARCTGISASSATACSSSWAVPRGIPPTTKRNNLAIHDRRPPDGVRHVRGHDPARRVRRRQHDDLGRRPVRAREVARRRGHLHRRGAPGRAARSRAARADPHGWRGREVDVAAAPDEDGCRGPAAAGWRAVSSASEQADEVAARGRSRSASRTARARAVMPEGSRAEAHADASPRRATSGASAPGRPRVELADAPAGRCRGSEVKWDGIRAIGVWDGRRLHLRARSGNDITFKYPELTRVDAGLGPEPAVVDGEIVALDAQGRPSFPRLQRRMNLSKPREIERETPRTPVHYFLFDVLAHAGADVAVTPPRRAARASSSMIAAGAIAPIVLPPVFDDVDAALAAARTIRPRGDRRQGPRLALSPRAALGAVAEGEDHPHAGGRDRRDPARTRRPVGRRSDRCCSGSRGRRAAVRGSGRIGIQRLDAREARRAC